MADAKAVCPKCHTQYRVDESHVGERARCKRCGAVFPVLSSAAAAADDSQSHPKKVARAARALAVEVDELASGAFSAPGPLFSEARKGILEKWLANFAANLRAAGHALEDGRDMGGNVISPPEIADGLERLCAEYGKAAVLQRLQEVCGTSVRSRLQAMLQRAGSIVLAIRRGPLKPSASVKQADDLAAQVARAVGGDLRSETDSRSFRDYPVLLECSRQFASGKPSAGVARELSSRTKQLVNSEPDFDLAYMWLAICQDAADDFPAAVQTLLEGIRRSKRKGHLCATLAEKSMDRGHLDISLRAAARAVDLGTDLYIAHHIMAEALDYHGMRKAANTLRDRVPTVLDDYMRDRIRRLAEQQDTAQTREFVRAFGNALTG